MAVPGKTSTLSSMGRSSGGGAAANTRTLLACMSAETPISACP